MFIYLFVDFWHNVWSWQLDIQTQLNVVLLLQEKDHRVSVLADLRLQIAQCNGNVTRRFKWRVFVVCRVKY
jgi:hypothetical protein